jgi:glycerophosphoryl diester phosphodiesterase
MRTRLLSVVIAIAAFVALSPASADLPLDNPWLDRTPLNFAHQGGAKEAPSNTLYAFKRALKKGADVLEMDVHATSDRQLVVLHDSTADRTTNGTGRIDSMTLAQVKQLDAAYWWSPGTVDCHSTVPGECDWVFRGVATGQKKPPGGYSANDFKIPTLVEVLQTFPGVYLNIEIKETAPETVPYERELAELLGAYGRGDDTIVVSFLDNATESFKAAATVFAPNVSTATGTVETAAFYGTAENALPGAPNPRYQALQVPIVFEGIQVVDQDFVDNAKANGLAVHVWTIDDADEMAWLLDLGVNGIMTDVPSTLEKILRKRHI